MAATCSVRSRFFEEMMMRTALFSVVALARFIHEAAAAKWMGLDLTLAA